MAREVEIKILNVKPQLMRLLLKKHNAKLVMPRNKQVNYFFENSYTSNKKQTIRIREDSCGATFTIKSTLRVIKGHKSMKEYEIKIDNSKKLMKGLKLIGFNLIGQAELYREDWKLYGCLITIGKFPRIPSYLEIEGTRKNIAKVAKILDYSNENYVSDSLLKVYNLKSKFLVFNRKTILKI
jgi:predicted adenylyl cyclase CyaB